MTQSRIDTLEKRSDETLPLTFDFLPEMVLANQSGLTILIAPAPTVTSANQQTVGGSTNLTVSNITIVGTTIVAWFSGGTKSEKYTILCTIALSDNKTTRVMPLIIQNVDLP